MKKLLALLLALTVLVSCGKSNLTEEIRRVFMMPSKFETEYTINGTSGKAEIYFDGIDVWSISFTDGAVSGMEKTFSEAKSETGLSDISLENPPGTEPFSLVRKAFIRLSGESFPWQGGDLAEYEFADLSDSMRFTYDAINHRPKSLELSDGSNEILLNFK